MACHGWELRRIEIDDGNTRPRIRDLSEMDRSYMPCLLGYVLPSPGCLPSCSFASAFTIFWLTTSPCLLCTYTLLLELKTAARAGNSRLCRASCIQ